MMVKNNFMTKCYEWWKTLTKLAERKDIIQINVDAVLSVGNTIKDEELKLRFFGRKYLELVDELKKAGIIN